MDQYTQDSRLISIDTKLGKDELLLTAFEGAEHISNLFEYRLAAISSNHDIKPEDIIGEEVTVTINTKNKVSFHGFINTFSYGEMQAHNLREYRFTMVPWLWFLSRTENRRIFQNKNTKDIVTQIFSDLGFKDFEFKAQGGVPREYCVQYGESDLHFVSRLLEEEGIAYYFKQGAKKHTLVLVDQKNAYEMCVDTNLTYSRGSTPDNQITRWSHNYEFRKGVWTLNDYNFKEPGKSQLAEAKTTSKFSNVANYQHYEYPGVYDFPSNREQVNMRMDAEEVPMKFVLITILGGLGNFWGPLLGAMILIPLQEYTRAYLTVLGSGVDLIIFGLIIVLMMIKQPRGIMGIVTDFGARRRRAEARPDTGV